jgi:hypothetical protein
MRQHPDGHLLPARQRPSHAFAPAASHAVVRIANDRGGQIGGYVERYEQLRATGQTVMIDGLCASSCTIVLGAIPHEKICVTRNANLAFHAAWDLGARGQAITNPGATRMLYSMYPSQVRHWIAHRGGLSPTYDLSARQAAGGDVSPLVISMPRLLHYG